MIKRYSLIIAAFLVSIACYAQQDPLQIYFETSGTPDAGSTYDVDVRVADFNQLTGAQFIIAWDSLVLEIDTLPFITGDLSDFDGNAISLPNETASMTKGQLRLVWFTFSPASLPDDHLLFTMRFNVVGSACDTTSVDVTDLPPNFSIEITDQNFQNIGAEWSALPVMVPGTDCGGIDPPIGDDVALIFPDVFADPGETICLPFTTVNFDSVETFQGSLMWDPSILEYSSVQNFGLPGMNAGSFNLNNTASGMASFVWFDNTGTTPVTIADNGTIFELCFEVIGDLGQSSVVKAFNGTPSIQISSPQPVGVRDFVIIEGSVTIGENTEGQEFSIKADTVSVELTDMEVCVDFSTLNFDDIAGMQYTLQWDPMVLAYDRVEAVVPAFASTFNPAGNNRLRYSWTNPAGVGLDLADGTVIYRVCFDIVGDCDGATALNFISEPGRPIEITDGTFNSLPPSEVNMMNGRVEIVCGIQLDASITNVRCNGESNGAINLNISGGTSPYDVHWEWDNGNSEEDFSGVTVNSLLAGQSADTYCVTVTDDIGTSVQDCYDIIEPEPLVVDVSINGNTVTIDITGGNGNYTQEINPAISDLNNVPDGTYTILATDGRGCTATEIFVIGPECSDPVELSTIAFSAICGDDGRIQVNCSGGSGNYNISSNPQLTFSNGAFENVPVGSYEITCVDSDNPDCSETTTVEVLQGTPDDLLVSIANIVDVDCSGADGSFDVNVEGGCEPYDIQYRLNGGNPLPYNPQAGYGEGNYEVIVEDANGTTATASFEISVDTGGELNITNVVRVDAPCTGMNGQATFTVSGRCGSISCSVLLNGTNLQTCNLTNNGNNYTGSFPVGTHTITLTDDETGETATIQFTIIVSPMALRASLVSAMDGMIDINVTGGTPPFQFFWMGPGGQSVGNTEDLSGLTESGMYSVNILDAQGCSFALTVNLAGTGEPSLNLDPVEFPFGGFATPCFDGDCMGLISGSINGGLAPYTILLTDESLNETEVVLNDAGGFEIGSLCAGSYEVVLTDSDGFTIVADDPVVITAPGPIVIEEDELNCPDAGQSNGSILAIVSGGTNLGYIYSWDPPSSDPVPGPNNENLETGIYSLTVTDSNGCEASASFDLMTDCGDTDCFIARKVFTPNSDGMNDFFSIRCAGNMGYRFTVFDRWGALVFENSNYTNNWAGIDLDGNELPEGAYYWVLDTNNRIYRGTVTLLRE